MKMFALSVFAFFALGFTPLFEDKARLIDENYKDEGVDKPLESVVVGTTINKWWLVKNIGDEQWQGRRIVAISKAVGLVPKGPGTVKHQDQKSPVIEPGEFGRYEAALTATKVGVWTVHYKQEKKVNGKWEPALPNQKGVWVTLRVTPKR